MARVKLTRQMVLSKDFLEKEEPFIKDIEKRLYQEKEKK
jgi:hypothetical protein